MTQEQMNHKPIFIDKNLASIIEARLANQNLPLDQNSLEQLLTLNISNANISALDGIESCKNLRFLAASQNQLTSLAPLKELTALEVVSVWGNQLTSLAVLEKLPNLTQVYAFDNPLEECSASELLAMSFFKLQPVENREFACLDVTAIIAKKQLLAAEAERQRVEAEQAAQAERQRVEAEQAAQAERQRVEAEQAAQAERQRVEAEQAAQAERQRVEAEQAAQAERQRLEAEQAAEAERQRVEAEQAAQAERQRVEAERRRLEASVLPLAQQIHHALEITDELNIKKPETTVSQVSKIVNMEQKINRAKDTVEIYYYAGLAKTAEEQLAILQNKFITTSCIRQLFQNQIEEYIFKFIFVHEKSNSEIMKLVLQQVSAQALFKMYTAYEFQKYVQATTNADQLKQYARIALDEQSQRVILQHSLVTERCIEILLQNQPEAVVLELIAKHEVTPARVRESIQTQCEPEPQQFSEQASLPTQALEQQQLEQQRQEEQRVLAQQINEAANIAELQRYAQKATIAELQLCVLKHRLVSASTIAVLLEQELEAYVLKVIFSHDETTADIMQHVLQRISAHELFQMYATHEFKKLIQATTSSQRLEQYARIALSSDAQFVILRNEATTLTVIETLMQLQPEVYILKVIMTHACTPVSLQNEILAKLEEQEQVQLPFANDEQILELLKTAETAEQLEKYARIVTTAAMQLFIINHQQVNQSILQIMSEKVTDLTILKTILNHRRVSAATIQIILEKMNEVDREKVLTTLSPTEFENLVNMVDSEAGLAFFARFALTTLKQLVIIRNRYITLKIIDILFDLSPEAYAMQQLRKKKGELMEPEVQVLAPETPKVAPRASNRFSKESQQSEYQPEANSQQSALAITEKVRQIEAVKTSDELLPFLAENNRTLNIAIAKSLLATEAILEQLIDLQDEEVDRYISKSRKLTGRLRAKMYNLKKQQKAKAQPHLEKQDIYAIVKTIDFAGKLNLAQSQDMGAEDYFPALVREPRNEIRQALVDNPKVPNDILRVLANDRITTIASSARQRLAGFQNPNPIRSTDSIISRPKGTTPPVQVKPGVQSPMTAQAKQPVVATAKVEQPVSAVAEFKFDFELDDQFEEITLVDLDEL